MFELRHKIRETRRGGEVNCEALGRLYEENVLWDGYRDSEVYHGVNIESKGRINIMTYFLTLAYWQNASVII